jgi:hypothetical protein
MMAGTWVFILRPCHHKEIFVLLRGWLRGFGKHCDRLLAQSVFTFCTAAVWTNRTRREKRCLAGLADFTSHRVTLFLETPVARNFHFGFILSASTIKMIAAFQGPDEFEDTFLRLSNPIKNFYGTIKRNDICLRIGLL